MALTYEQFWYNNFHDQDSVLFANVINTIASVAKLTPEEQNRISKSLVWLKKDNHINRDNFISLFTFINGNDATNFKDRLLHVDKILGDIIRNTSFVDRDLQVKPPITRDTYYTTPSEFLWFPPNLFYFNFIDKHLKTASIPIAYDTEDHVYRFTIGIATIRSNDAKTIIDDFENNISNARIVGYTQLPYQRMWDEMMSNSRRVSLDEAVEAFTNIILSNKNYRKGDEDGAIYLVSWLETNKKGVFYIDVHDFFNLLKYFDDEATVPQKIDINSYIYNLSKWMKQIFECDGFVNISWRLQIPLCYYYLRRGSLNFLQFDYVDKYGGKSEVHISYKGKHFTIENSGSTYIIDEISVLVNMIKMSISKSCGREPLKAVIPNIVVVTNTGNKFYYSDKIDGVKKELGDICNAAKLLSNDIIILGHECDELKSMSGPRGSVAYAPWNMWSANITLPSWFNTYEINKNKVEDYKQGTLTDADYVPILQDELLMHIYKIFGAKMFDFLSHLNHPLISVATDTLLPYLIYLVYRQKVLVIEVNDSETIMISGYGERGNRVYEKYSITDINIQEIKKLMNKFQKFIPDNRLFTILSKFYDLEAQNYYINSSPEGRVKWVDTIVSQSE